MTDEVDIEEALANAREVVEWSKRPPAFGRFPPVEENPSDSVLLARAVLVLHEAAEDNAALAAGGGLRAPTVDALERVLELEAEVERMRGVVAAAERARNYYAYHVGAPPAEDAPPCPCPRCVLDAAIDAYRASKERGDGG